MSMINNGTRKISKASSSKSAYTYIDIQSDMYIRTYIYLYIYVSKNHKPQPPTLRCIRLRTGCCCLCFFGEVAAPERRLRSRRRHGVFHLGFGSYIGIMEKKMETTMGIGEDDSMVAACMSWLRRFAY